jgi:hypothetical protein
LATGEIRSIYRTRNYLEAHPEMLDEIEQQVLVKHGIVRGGKDSPKPNGATAAAGAEDDAATKGKKAAAAARPS